MVDTPNTWSKGRNGDWLVRGRAGQAGTVTVSKRDGSTSQATITRQVWTDGQVALYAVQARAQSNGGGRGRGCHTGGDCSSLCSPTSCPCGDGAWFSCC